jgi:hypothetical protein
LAIKKKEGELHYYIMKLRGSPTANTAPKIAAIVTSPTAIDLKTMFIDSPL